MPYQYLNSRDYYLNRKSEIEARIVYRGYYAGTPYTRDPNDPSVDFGSYRKALLAGGVQTVVDAQGHLIRVLDRDPTKDRARDIDYMENLFKARIDSLAAGVVPRGSSVQFNPPPDYTGEPLTAQQREDLCRVLLNFDARYDDGEKTFFQWLRLALKDVGVTGDGLLTLSYEPDDKRCWYNYYPFEYSDWENDAVTNKPLYYRIEFKVLGDDLKEYFYRVDIYRDRIVHYQLMPVKGSWLTGLPNPVQMAVALDGTAGYVPMDMTVDTARSGDPWGVLGNLSGFSARDIAWSRENTLNRRGSPEVGIDGLAAVDAVNELLNQYSDAVIYAGHQPLAVIDASPPKDAKGKVLPWPKRLQAGSFIDIKTSDGAEDQAKLAYPENVPDTFPHPEALSELRGAAMAGVPHFRSDNKTIAELARLSGYAYRIIMTDFLEKVEDVRENAVDPILRMLNLGIEMLELKGALPAGIPKGTRIAIKYADQQMTEDELQKRVMAILGMHNMGVPMARLLPLFPMAIDNPEQLKAELEKIDQEHQAMQDQAMEATQAQIDNANNPAPAKPKAPDGTDNQLK